MPQQIFEETWTVTPPRPGQEYYEGPTTTRRVQGLGYQPAVGGYGGQGGQAFYGTLRAQPYLDSLQARADARRNEMKPLPPIILGSPSEEAVLREQIQVRQLEIELAALDAPPAHAAPSPVTWLLPVLLVVALVISLFRR